MVRYRQYTPGALDGAVPAVHSGGAVVSGWCFTGSTLRGRLMVRYQQYTPGALWSLDGAVSEVHSGGAVVSGWCSTGSTLRGAVVSGWCGTGSTLRGRCSLWMLRYRQYTPGAL
ncbi:hypothetical protein GDO81_023758 [Engystomops pustulosus]|uniref:Uncharacterized protein n=1 Tax=Engystomops pustulosus TaxID=76066 RepID=A0AAV6Z5U0_ENGPU|nr:hypothetical protein GDO81_023758 [Engystomops pustulosus]